MFRGSSVRCTLIASYCLLVAMLIIIIAFYIVYFTIVFFVLRFARVTRALTDETCYARHRSERHMRSAAATLSEQYGDTGTLSAATKLQRIASFRANA